MLFRSYSIFAAIPKLILLICISFSLVACSQNKKTESTSISNASAKVLYLEARSLMSNNDFKAAISKYEILEAQYPLGRYAQQALLEQAYAYYKFDEPDTALDTIDRYIRVYPRSPRMDYAYYLRGLINFTRGGSIIDRIIPRNYKDLDSTRQREAFDDFATIIRRYPGSPYTADAKKRLHYLKNAMAQSEVSIAQYYMKRGAYLAAYNRADYAIKHYQETPAIVSALKIKHCAAKRLGKESLANDALRILKLNFPDQSSVACRFK